MARLFKDFYKPEVILHKQKFYAGLGEKERRHFLGQEYLSLGKGSQRYLSRVFGCSRTTIQKGSKEVKADNFAPDYSYHRSRGQVEKKGRGANISD